MPIYSETIAEVREHIDETFVSEEMVISHDKLKLFLEATGDINPIHFDKQWTTESVLSELVSGKVIIPGFLTLSLCASEKVLYKALKINEHHEVISLQVTSKFTKPVPVDARVIYECQLSSVRDRTIQSRPAIIVDWNIRALMISQNDGKNKESCINVEWTVAYVALKV